MNRLVRLSLTLFITAIIMLVMVMMRLRDAKLQPLLNQENELQMAYLGLGITAVLMIGGIVMLVKAYKGYRQLKEGAATADPVNE